MHLVSQRSIAFRLWLGLSIVATFFTTFALGIYVWLTIGDNVQNAHREADAKIQSVLLIASRFGPGYPSLSDTEFATAEGLGIRAVDIFDKSGYLVTSLALADGAPAGQPADEKLVSAALTGHRVDHQVGLNSSEYSVTSISPLTAVKGGEFGEVHYVPLSVITPGQPGAVRILMQYPDLAGEARRLLIRSLLVAFMIITATVLGIWTLLKHFVSKPLSRYSELAMRIAKGEFVRMPADGGDELSQLGRSVNGMADALEYKATVDSLTGLHNLRHLSSTLEGMISDVAMSGTQLSVIVADLDNLKPVNDTHGHQAGDRVLRAVANAIRDWAGPRCTCWRLGGDEFAVALPGLDNDDAALVAANLREAVAAIRISTDGATIEPAISVGVATYPEDGDSAGTLLGIADRRMYEAKTMRAQERKMAGTSAA